MLSVGECQKVSGISFCSLFVVLKVHLPKNKFLVSFWVTVFSMSGTFVHGWEKSDACLAQKKLSCV